MPGYSHPGQHSTDGYIAELLRRQQGLAAGILAVSPAGIEAHHDKWTVAATPATTYTLTYLPLDQAVWVTLNGVTLDEGTDYTCDYTTGIITVNTTNQTLTTGDVLLARYLSTGDLVAQSAPPLTGALTDSFNRADGPLGVADSGQTWVTTGSGTAVVASNQATISGTTGNVKCLVDLAVSDVTAQVTIKAKDGNGYNATGLIFRAQDVGNAWLFNHDGSLLKGDPATTGTVVASYAAFVVGDVMKVVVSGPTISCYKNGTLLGSVTDSTYETATQHGMFLVYAGSAGALDDIDVR